MALAREPRLRIAGASDRRGAAEARVTEVLDGGRQHAGGAPGRPAPGSNRATSGSASVAAQGRGGGQRAKERRPALASDVRIDPRRDARVELREQRLGLVRGARGGSERSARFVRS